MKVIVQKYGGSSLAAPELIERIAGRVIATKERGYSVVVVVSALGDTTDHLVALAKQITQNPPPREMDMLLSVGERVSIALLTMAIIERGHTAISFTGSQVGIITTTDHTRARILEIKGDRIRQELEQGKIVVIAGFQGVSVEKEITTLGRGGSDTTAVALAAALDAEACEIMTDVDGVYTADPQLVPSAERLRRLSFDEMLDMADSGAQVLKSSAVEFAKRHNIKLEVGSSFTGEIGTIITNGELDRNRVTGVGQDANIVLVKVTGENEGTRAALITSLARNGVPVKFVWQSGNTLAFLLSADALERAHELIAAQQASDPALRVETDHDLGLLAITGTGINFGTDIMARAMEVFEEMALRPRVLQFSETRLCFGVDKRYLKQAVNAMHHALFDRS
ncbi:MAG: aspartate kinase [bacterium]